MIEAHQKSHRKPIEVLEKSYSGRLICSMLALIPQSGDFSLCLGRLGLPDRLPFSKPKVNWLLHTRSAFRRTPSGREMVAKPAGNLWQTDFHPTATRENQSGNRVISEDIEISESKYKLNKKHIKYLHNSK